MPTLRPATDHDIPQVAEVFIAARTQCLAFLNWHYDFEVMKGVFGRRLHDSEMWVMEVDTQVVGFIDFVPRDVDDLYVHPDYHGRGFGTRLLKKALERLGPPVWLWVFQENAKARAFYEKHGFELEFETNGEDNTEKAPDARYVWPGSQ